MFPQTLGVSQSQSIFRQNCQRKLIRKCQISQFNTPLRALQAAASAFYTATFKWGKRTLVQTESQQAIENWGKTTTSLRYIALILSESLAQRPFKLAAFIKDQSGKLSIYHCHYWCKIFCSTTRHIKNLE